MKYVVTTGFSKINALKTEGVNAAKRNDWVAARNCFANAIAQGASDSETVRNLAVSCLRVNDVMEATRAYKKLLELVPDNVQYLREAGSLFFDAGMFVDAEAAWRRCPVDLLQQHQLCRAILMQETASAELLAEADNLLKKIVGRIAGFDEIMLKGTLAHRNKDNENAAKWFKMAADLRPGDISALSNLAKIQKAGRDAAGFAETARKICKIQPDCEWLCEDLGEERPGPLPNDEIELMIRSAIEHRASAANWNGMAKFYQSRLQLHAARLAFDKALEVAKGTPDEVKLLWNCSLLMLLMGSFEEGCKLYESRLELSGMIHVSKIMPQWNGEPLFGKTLMVYSEQGMGDILQFVRFVPLIKQMFGGTINLVVQKPLVPLFKNIPYVDNVLEYIPGVQAQEICRYDYAVAMLSLPLRMNLPYVAYPRDKYIDVSGLECSADIKKITADIRSDKRLKIGFCSSGNPDLPRTKIRDCPLEHIQPLLEIEEVLWVNLNKNLADYDFGANTINPMNAVRDFVDTAALVESCDVILTVDTAIAHLSGALGKPVWLLLFFESEWRWGVNVEDNFWYPTMRIFRQPTFGDWADCVQRVRTEIGNSIKKTAKAL
ncbi:MAG: tetratricopeptide repeat protein [Negativicutes bacterium]|jgi:tetratricopeptide (TPR) repeat protein